MASISSIIEQEQRAYIKCRSLLKDSNKNIHNDSVVVCRDRDISQAREARENELRNARPKSAEGDLSIDSVTAYYIHGSQVGLLTKNGQFLRVKIFISIYFEKYS